MSSNKMKFDNMRENPLNGSEEEKFKGELIKQLLVVKQNSSHFLKNVCLMKKKL